MSRSDRLVTPADAGYQAQRRYRRWVLATVIVALAGFIYWMYIAQVPKEYASDSDHFLHGSIGSDNAAGIPLSIWKILPDTFPEYLPDAGRGYLRVKAEKAAAGQIVDHRDGYAQFGFLLRDGHDLPIGFSQRRYRIDLVGLNCAVCHTGTLAVDNRQQADAIYEHKLPAEYIGSTEPPGAGHVLIYGMPAHSMDLEAYFTFLFRCAEDPRFNESTILGAIDAAAQRGWGRSVSGIERALTKIGVRELRKTLLERRQQLHYLSGLAHAPGEPVVPRFGPGRIDTFSPYKSIQFGFPFDGTYGIADYPSIWNQRPREGMHLHWDGNNSSVFERNISASIGAGVTPVSIDMPRMLRVARWIGAPPPENSGLEYVFQNRAHSGADPFQPFIDEMPIPNYPFPIDQVAAARGHKLFRTYCARCHGDWTTASGPTTAANESLPGVGQVVPLPDIQTDAARLESYTEALRNNQYRLGSSQWWRFSNFRKTNGYANSPLDGVWIRAPYLHNGSVPSLYDLFSRPCTPEDYATLGLTAQTDLNQLAADPDRVAKMIAQARSLRVRPPVFYRGDDQYDQKYGGFRCDRARGDDGRATFFYSTIRIADGKIESLYGNGHQGHYEKVFSDGASYGDELPIDSLWALIEFQKLLGSSRDKVLP